MLNLRYMIINSLLWLVAITEEYECAHSNMKQGYQGYSAVHCPSGTAREGKAESTIVINMFLLSSNLGGGSAERKRGYLASAD